MEELLSYYSNINYDLINNYNIDDQVADTSPKKKQKKQ